MMKEYWEWWLLGIILLAIVVYIIAYEWLLWRATRRWILQQPDGSESWHVREYDANPRPNIRRA